MSDNYPLNVLCEACGERFGDHSAHADECPGPAANKYAERECPCGIASADCEYHR